MKFIEITYAILFAFVVIILSRKILLIARNNHINRKSALFYPLAIFIWFIASLLLSFKGFFKSAEQFSTRDIFGLIYLIILMSIPLASFFILLKKSLFFQKMIRAITLKFIFGILTFRILGMYFILLWLTKKAPLLFALPTGMLDIFIGITAPLLAYRNVQLSNTSLKFWNYIGIFDFVLAFSLYFLCFPFKLIKVPANMIMWGGFYPVAFIVMFVVPLSTILHIIAIKKINNKI